MKNIIVFGLFILLSAPAYASYDRTKPISASNSPVAPYDTPPICQGGVIYHKGQFEKCDKKHLKSKTDLKTYQSDFNKDNAIKHK